MNELGKRAVADAIFAAYMDANDRDVQGLCALIASDIIDKIGGVLVAGELVWASCRRTHWWVDVDGETVDPMGDWQMDGESFYRHEAHRNQQFGKDFAAMYAHKQLCLDHIESAPQS